MISYRGDEAFDWFGCSRVRSLTVGYAGTTSRIDSLDRRKTLTGALRFARLLFFGYRGELQKMTNESSDLLRNAAAVWKKMSEFSYHFTYGYKNKLYGIQLLFPPERFPHIAGFQYLKDIALPRYNPSKILDMILAGKIRADQIEKGIYYEESVKPRLQAISRLQETIEDTFLFYSYRPEFYSFSTRIQADYLVSSTSLPADFIFIIKSDSRGEAEVCDFVCCSAFEQTGRDFRENQRMRTILKKERFHIPTGTSVILFDRLSRQLQKV